MDEEDEDWEEDLEQVKARTIKQQRKAVPLSDYLEKHTKAELVELMGELTDTYPDVREFLEDYLALCRWLGSDREETLHPMLKSYLED